MKKIVRCSGFTEFYAVDVDGHLFCMSIASYGRLMQGLGVESEDECDDRVLEWFKRTFECD